MPWRLLVRFLSFLIWILQNVTCVEGDHNTCIFYYWQVDWQTAVNTCRRDSNYLLCYKGKQKIDDITEAFKLAAFGNAKLGLWLSNRNCASDGSLESCLSLHIQKENDTMWHYFQNKCEERYPFVCCVKETGDNITSEKPSTSTTEKPVVTPTGSGCKGVFARGINWPDTDAGMTAVRPCPGNSTGEARWICDRGRSAKRKRRGPDLSKCRSREIQNLKEKFNTTSASDMISDLENVFRDRNKTVFGEDMSDVLSMMAALPDKLFLELDDLEGAEKWTETNRNVYKVATVIDHFVELEDTWEDIDENERNALGTNLLSTVDAMGSLLADSMPGDVKEESILGNNMALQVLRPELGESVTFPEWDNVTVSYPNRGRMVLEEGYESQLPKDKGNVSLVFVLYNDMAAVLSPTQAKNDARGTLNSAVVSATVIQGRESVSISNLVTIQIQHLISKPNKTGCVFWNMHSNQWDPIGCYLESSNDTHSTCICNHLTNFALLMDYADVIGETDHDSFNYITLIGCSFSIICLAFCVLILSCFSYYSSHSWSMRYVILRNLCLTLLIANLVLVVGMDRTENKQICAVVAGLLHYFFLSAFSWMFLEAVHIYLLLVVVFASRKSHSEKYYLFGYGFPAIIVLITAVSRPNYYGRPNVCWLSTEKGTIWAFTGPIAIILILNTCALVLAQYKASKISKKDDNIKLFKRWLRVTVILFPVLGITWVFGFLFLGKNYKVVGYLFAVLNSFQGVCIFIFHGLVDKKARRMLMDSIRSRSTAVHSGSSGFNKKANEQAQNGDKRSSMTPVENGGTSSPKIAFQSSDDKSCSICHKPWSFCFKLPVTDDNTRNEAAIVHCNCLRERNSVF